MKKTLTPIILSLIFVAQASPAFCESRSFQVSAYLPVSVLMTRETVQQGLDNTALAANKSYASQMVQEQNMARGRETVLVRSVVAL